MEKRNAHPVASAVNYEDSQLIKTPSTG